MPPPVSPPPPGGATLAPMFPLCLTPEIVEPTGTVSDPRLWEAPPRLGVPGPRTRAGKQVYGNNYDNHLETENFTIQWEDGDGAEADAEMAAEGLEAAWTYFVEEKGWDPPVSSDEYYVWVLLVTDLGYTGFTTEYTTSKYPEGYPVIYLDTTYATDDDWWRALAEHEFHHALQYRQREYTGAAGESWYWEASAMWAATLVEPENDASDYVVGWYVNQSDIAFNSTEGYHHYGIFPLNGWLDTMGPGEGTMQATWETSAGMSGAPWDEVLEAATGLDRVDIWAGFSGAFGNELYSRGEPWPDVEKNTLEDGAEGEAKELGTVYYRLRGDETVEVSAVVEEGEVVLSGVAGTGETLSVAPGEILAVTATGARGASWSLRVATPEGDTGVPGTGDSGGRDEQDRDEPEEEPGGCGCGGQSPAWWAAVVGAMLARYSRRISPDDAGAQSSR